MTEEKEKNRSNLTDEKWQQTNELGDVPTTFHYLTKGGVMESVDAVGTIPPAPVVDDIDRRHTTKDYKTGIKSMDHQGYGRDIICLVFNINGRTLQTIMENKGPDLYNKMRMFALKLAGTSLSSDEAEEEKK